MASSSSLTRTHTLGITDKTFIVRNVWNFLLNRFPSLHRYSVWYQSTSHLDFLMTQHKSLLFPLTQFWHKDLRSRGNQSVYFQNAQKGGWRDCQWDFWKSSFRGRNNDQKNINSIRPHGATLSAWKESVRFEKIINLMLIICRTTATVTHWAHPGWHVEWCRGDSCRSEGGYIRYIRVYLCVCIQLSPWKGSQQVFTWSR